MNVTGTMPKTGGKGAQLYSRELSNVNNKITSQALRTNRGISKDSNGSITSTGGNKFGGTKLSSDNKSLVRQALKNQKRNQKITVGENSQLRPIQ